MRTEAQDLLDCSLKLLTRRAAPALCRLAAIAVDPAQIRFEDTAVNVAEHRADTVLLLGAEADPDRWGWHLEYQLEPDPRVIPGWLLKNAVLWATNEEQPLEVTGAGVLDISIWMQKNSLAVHLVNLTNPMMMKGPLREIIPSPPQRVQIHVPEGRTVSGVHLLVGGGKASFQQTKNVIDVTIPSVGLHEVIAVDL